MRTTLDINSTLMRAARQRAAAEGRTLTSLIEEALRLLLGQRKQQVAYRLRWVTKRGAALPEVDVADRDLLYERMEGRA